MDHTVVVKTEMQSNGEILLFYVDGECAFFISYGIKWPIWSVDVGGLIPTKTNYV